MIRQHFTVMLFFLFFSLFLNAQKQVHAFKSITDVEGNNYRTIQVGNQELMAENLRTSSFRDAFPITYTEQDREWFITKKAAWCYYDYLPSYNVLNGKLYNEYVILNSKGICPSGWRIPSKKDWDDVQSFLGRNWLQPNKSLKKVYTGKVCHLPTVGQCGKLPQNVYIDTLVRPPTTHQA